jgi:hypothetical protein
VGGWRVDVDVWWCWKASEMRIGVLTSSLEP